MASSQSYDKRFDRSDIIEEALELCNAYDPGFSLQQKDVDSCNRSLTMMLRAWQADGVGLWLQKELALFPQEDEWKYDIGPSSSDHCTESWVKTELAAAGATADTSLTIDATTDMVDSFDRDAIITATTPSASGSITLSGTLVSNAVAYLPDQRKVLIYSDADDSGDTYTLTGTDANGATVTETITGPNTTTVYSVNTYFTITSVSVSGAATGNIEVGVVGGHVGIELDDGTVQWTYWKAALSTTMQIVTALTGAAAIDNHVYVYDKKAQRPLEIIEARRRNAANNDIPLNIVSRSDYMRLSNKEQTGTVNSVYYDPQRTSGDFYIWPACKDVQEYIRFTARYPFEDMDVATDELDLPPEWHEAVCWNLATRIAPKFGRQVDQLFKMDAIEMYSRLKDFDREMEATTIHIVR